MHLKMKKENHMDALPMHTIKKNIINEGYHMNGSCALYGKILLVRIVENNEIDAFLGQFRSGKG